MRAVYKFGGTSLETTQKIKEVAKFIKRKKLQENLELIVVVSAMGKTTDKLNSLVLETSNNPNPITYAKILTMGELLSCQLLSLALEELGVQTQTFSAEEIKIHAKGHPLSSVITHIDQNFLLETIKTKVAIVAGFQGIDDRDNRVALGRGGSDTTAVALGCVLNAKVCIFTDVDGYFTCDPFKYENAKSLKKISIYSALEQANAGAKVLDKRCLELANANKLDLSVKMSQKDGGTDIEYKHLEGYHLDCITCKNNCAFVKYTYKNTDYLEKYLQKQNISYYFMEKTKHERLKQTSYLLSEEDYNKIPIKTRKKINACLVDELVLTGSGLTFHKDFFEKTQKVLKNAKTKVIYMALHPTFLKILVKQGQGEKLTKLLHNNLFVNNI